MTSRLFCCLGFSLLLATPYAASAQVLRGTVVDADTRTPVSDARVTLLNAAGDSVAAAASTARGFSFNPPRDGVYRLRVQHLAYTVTQTDTVRVESGTEVTVTVLLGRTTIPLEPLRVDARRVPLLSHLADIAERRRQGGGWFVTRDQIEARPGADIKDLLASVPGVRVVGTEHGDVLPQIRARLGADRELSEDPRVAAYQDANACPSKLIVDGVVWVSDHQVLHKVFSNEALRNNEQFMLLHGSEIEVIEVYNGAASIPDIYGGTDAACGVIAVWLRRDLKPTTPPPAGVQRPILPSSAFASVSALSISGRHAPASAAAFEVGYQWSVTPRTALGLQLRHASAPIPSAVMDDITAPFEHGSADTGPRRTSVWTGSVDLQYVVNRTWRWQPVVSGRVLAAQRSLNPFLQPDSEPVRSRGWGGGVEVSVQRRVSDRVAAQLGAGYDRIAFGSYAEIERPSHPTAATWEMKRLRAGVTYALGR